MCVGYVTCMHCGLSLKTNTRRIKIVKASFLRLLLRVVGKNPKTPKLSPWLMTPITRGGVGSLVSLVYICEYSTKNIAVNSISRNKQMCRVDSVKVHFKITDSY